MKYFILSSAVENVGRVPQCIPSVHYNYWSDCSIWNINYWGKIEPNIKIPDKFHLHHNARWTDFINDVSFKINAAQLCSEKAFEVLSGFQLAGHQDYNCIVSKKTIEKMYHFLYFYEIHNNYVDYTKSKFFYSKNTFIRPDKLELVEFENAEDYQQKRKEIYGLMEIGYYHIELVEDIQLDLFRLFGYYGAIIISDRLKTALEVNKLTGYRAIPFEEISDNKMFV